MDEEEKLENGSKKRRVDSEGKEGKLGGITGSLSAVRFFLYIS